MRVGGVPLTSVPQTQVTVPMPMTTKAKDADVPVAVESKRADVPVADEEPADLPPPPTSEPIKRDGPTRLLPQSHAAIDPLY